MLFRLPQEVTGAFATGGPVSRALRGFEPRPGQLRMAVAWAEAIARGETLVAEAATGIGKTLAYLVPVVLSGCRAIVSTGTRTLQQQLVENDIPLVREACRVPFTFAVLKGRGNYLCRRRWKRFAAEPAFEFAREAALFDRMREFAESTRTGDLSECPGIPEDFRAWAEVNARSETCEASLCPEAERCFLLEARRRAATADLVIVNHHLFFAALAVRARRERGGPDEAWRGARGELLPDAEVVVFDEAHGIEEVASSFFGVSLSLGRAHELWRDARRAAARADAAGRLTSLPAAEAFRRAADAFFGAIDGGEGRFTLPRRGEDTPFDRRASELLESAAELALSLAEGDAPASAAGEPDAEAQALGRRARLYSEELEAVLAADPSTTVSWGERRGPSVALWATPIEVSPALSGLLWSSPMTALLTSATLSVSGTLGYFRERVGLGAVDVRELIVDNEFDFAGRALAYVPSGLPDPGDAAFAAAAARETAQLLALSGGGTLVLCTSYRTLGSLEEALKGSVPYPVFVQGEAPRMQLLRAFREDGNAVLIGTGTFWEGIDVPGLALRCLVIDKLPFASPADPVVAARIRALRARGEDPFPAYQVPEAILALRQGVGRLLRRQDDFGVVVILDHRVATRSYGALFRANLPPMPWTRDRRRVEEFFGRFGRPAAEGEGRR